MKQLQVPVIRTPNPPLSGRTLYPIAPTATAISISRKLRNQYLSINLTDFFREIKARFYNYSVLN